MGIDIGHIVRHNFMDFENPKEVERFLYAAEEKLCNFFGCSRLEIVNNGETQDYGIYMSGSQIGSIQLYRGFWFIGTAYRFSQYLSCDFVRRMFFDFTNALGGEDGWSCDDNHSWNCSKFNIDEEDFDQWLKMANKAGIGEYSKDVQIGNPCEYNIFYDSFDDLKAELKQLQERFPDYQINTISTIGECFIRAIREGKLYLLVIN